jgi:membrane protease YdiL (CAAX protease family)
VEVVEGLAQELVRAASQIILLSAIPILWWLFSARRQSSFFAWIGLKRPMLTDKRRFLLALSAAFMVVCVMSPVLDSVLPDDVQLANERFAGQGAKALAPALIFSFLATALPEEVFFRAFLGKRLGNKFGFFVGNTIQAALFGLLHGIMLFGRFGVAVPVLVIAFTGTLGWLMGYMNDKANGSVFPSWLLHGTANLYAVTLVMFDI